MKTVAVVQWDGRSLVLSTVTFDRLWYAEWSGDASGLLGYENMVWPHPRIVP